MSAATDDLAAVRSLRSALWANGYRPVPVYSRRKNPSGLGWQDAARANPPAATRLPVTPSATSTGVLCDGLRAIDIDIEDAARSQEIEAIVRDMFGAAMVRFRQDSAKVLMLYRATEGEPKKRAMTGDYGKLEILGHGQQFVGWGVHPDGALYEWRDDSPLDVPRDALPAVSEDEISALFDACRGIIGAKEEITEKPISERALAAALPRKEITGREEAAAAKALDDEIARVASAPSGTRNDTLNAAAFNLGQIVGAGWIGRGEVESALLSAALACGLKAFEAQRTMRSGIEGGMKSPRPALADREGESAVIMDVTPLLKGRSVIVREPEIDDEDEDEEDDAAPLDEDLTRVPGLLGDLVEAIVRSARRPNRRLALAAALPLLGTVIGRRIATPTQSGTHLYVIATGATAMGKQHPINCIQRFMRSAGLARHLGPSQFMSMSALNKHAEGAPLSICPQDEFGAVLKRLSHPRASGHEMGISMVLRMLWGASFGVIATPAYATARSIEIAAPSLSLFAPTTPEELYSGLKGSDVVNGFLNRFLIIDSGERAEEVDPIEDDRKAAERLAPLLARAYRIGAPRRGNMAAHIDKNTDPDPAPLVVPWATQAAHDDYLALSHECLRRIDADHDTGAMYGRTAEIAIRLATIVACGEDHDAPTVTEANMAWASRLALQSAELASRAADRHMIDPLGAAEFERKIVEKLSQSPGRRMRMRALHKRMNKHIRFAGDLEKTLKAMQGAGIIALDRAIVPGGVSVTVRLM